MSAGLAYCTAADVVNDAPRPHLAVPHAAMAPLGTADLADPAWNGAAVVGTLTPSLSNDPPPASFAATKVRVLWDEKFLYVRFLCRDGDIYLPVHGHDAPLYQGDAVEVFLDPQGDQRQWYELQFNAANDAFEKLFLCTGPPEWDKSLRLTGDTIAREGWEFPGWDLPGLKSAAAPWREDGREIGWIVDVAVPAPAIGKRAGRRQLAPGTLRADFLRYDWPVPADPAAKRALVSTDWSPVPFGGPHRAPAAYGYLDLLPPSP